MALNLGDISFALGADTSGLDKSVQKLIQFSQKVDDAAKRTGDGAEATAAAYKKQEAAITSALNKVLNIDAAVQRAGGTAINSATAAADAFAKYTRTLTAGELSALAFQRANERLSLTLNKVRQDITTANNQNVDNTAAARLTTIFREMSLAAVLVTGPLGGVAARISAFAAIATRVNVATAAAIGGIALFADEMFKAGKAALNAGKEVDKYTESLFAVTGNHKIAQQSFNDLMDIANKSGYTVQTLGEEWVNFSETTKNTSLAGQKAEQVFKDIAVAMGNLHRSPEQVSGALRTMQIMMDNNVVSAQGLKKQLANDIPGAMEIGARAMGLSAANFALALKKGLIQTEDFLPKFAAEMKKTFSLTDSADTYEAAVARMHNANLTFFNDLDKSLGITTTSKGGIESWAKIVIEADNALKNMGPTLTTVTTAIITFTATTGAILALAQALRVMAVTLGILDVVALKSKLGMIVIGIAAATGAVFAGTKAFQDYNKAAKDVGNTISATTKQTTDYITALNGLKGGNQAVLAGNALWVAQKKAVEDAAAAVQVAQKATGLMPGAKISSNFIDADQVLKTHAVTEAQNRYNAALKALNELETALAKNSPHSPAFINDDQLKKLADAALKAQEAHDKLKELNDEIVKGRAALDGGGLEAYKKMKEQFADNMKVLEYAKALNQLPPAYREGLMSVEEYRNGLHDFTAELDKATLASDLHKKTVKDLEGTMTKAFDSIGKSIADMVTSGKFNMSSLVGAVKAAVSDMVQTIMMLSVLNPLKNSLFGLNGTSGQLPTMSNAGGGLSGLLGGLFGGSGGGVKDAAADSSLPWSTSFAGGAAKDGMAWSGGVRYLANGGILNQPTAFGTNSGIAIGGEAGTEAVMPLTRGRDGKLGVSGTGGGGSTVHVTIATPNFQSFAHPQSQSQIATSMRQAILQAHRNM